MFGTGGAPSTNTRAGRIQGRIGGTASAQGIAYPNPFFDLAHTYLPSTVKQMFQWCRYYYLTNALIASVVNKMAEYPITDLVIDSNNDGLRTLWDNYFERDLHLRSSMVDIGLFYHAYGNAIISLAHPFIKWLKCERCKTEVQATKAKYTFRSCKFYLACAHCGHDGDAEVRDQFLKTPHNTRLILWNPEDLDIRYNELTAETTYYYTLPGHIKNAIMVGQRDIVDRSPQVFIDAVKKQKAVVLDPDNVYHLRRPSILTGKLNRGWGTPLLMPVLKDTFYLQLMKKSQEAVLLERMLPLNILSPGMSAPGANPYELLNLKDWRDHVMGEIMKWRRDPLYMPVMPIPLQHQVIGGDGRALLLTGEMRQVAETIIAGMGCPPELVFGGLSWCLRGLTRISTVDGVRYLKDVVEQGECVEVLTEDGPRKITHLHRAGTKPALRLRTARGFELVGAGTHPVLVLLPDLRMEYKQLEELSENDYVVSKRGSTLWPVLPPGLPGGGHIGRESAIKTPSRLTKEAARLFGYITSEGYLIEDRLNFANVDVEVMDDFLVCFTGVFGFEPAVREAKQRGGHQQAYAVDVSKRALCRFLQKCGLGGRSHEKRVPPAILGAPASYVSEYLSSYFEGDGTVSIKPDWGGHVGATTVSEELARDIQLLLLNLGVMSSRYRIATKHRDRFDVVIRGKNDLIRFRELVGFRSSRKKERLDTLINGVKPTSDRIPYLWERLRLFRERCGLNRNNWQWSPVAFRAEQDWYTTDEVGVILGREPDVVRHHIKTGRLLAEKTEIWQGCWRVSGENLERFCSRFGRGVQVNVPNLRKGATRHNTADFDYSYIIEKDPVLAERIKAILDSDFVFDRVVSIDEQAAEEMYDLTVEGTHSYIADGLITHNSGSNVSLRMLENTFLRYMSGLRRLIRYFIIRRTAAHLDWPEVDVRFKPFKMADDLQRKAFLFQMNQAKLISDTTLLQDSDFNPEEEDELLRKEVKRRLEGIEEQQIAEAAIGGKAQVEQAKWQAKAQMVMAREQEQMQSGRHGAAPGEPGEGTTEAGVTPTATPEPTGQFQQMVERIRTLSPEAQQQVLQRISAQNGQLAQQIAQQLGTAQEGGDGSAGAPLPEQKPPRREAASI